jgi:hypothetical protein
MVIALPVLVCLIGLILYVLATPAPQRIARIGEIMFFAGLFVALLIGSPWFAKLAQ